MTYTEAVHVPFETKHHQSGVSLYLSATVDPPRGRMSMSASDTKGPIVHGGRFSALAGGALWKPASQ